MPAKSKAQQRFFGAELARSRSGKKTRTGLSRSVLRKFAKTRSRGLPARKMAS